MELVVRKEKVLFKVNLILALMFWTWAIVSIFKFKLFSILIFYVMILFAQSSLISSLKGNAIKISAEQFPDLFEKIKNACEKLKMPMPTAYLMNGNGLLNAFATKFLNRNYLVILSDIVDSLDDRKTSIDFYIGHELGHLHRKHLFWHSFFAPLILLPLLIPAYRRACELSCDQYGAFCCESPEDAVRALSVLAAGNRRWKSMSTPNFTSQISETGGFWMSFHEITSSYPWLSKRVALVQKDKASQILPKHSIAARILALLCPGFISGALFPILLAYLAIVIVAVFIIPKKAQKMVSTSISTSSSVAPSNTSDGQVSDSQYSTE